jgi:hypothetical protein
MHILLSLMLSTLASAQDKPPATPVPPPVAPPADKPVTPPATEESIFKTLVKQFSIGGQVRVRAEYRDPVSYANAATSFKSDDYILERIRLNLKFTVTDDIEVFLQPQDQRIWGQEMSVLTDERNLDLHQGYVDLRNLFSQPLSIRAGRFEMAYGDQRLISPLDWHNAARAWDGAKVRYAPKDFWVEAFYTVIRDPYPATLPTPFVPVPGATGINGAAEDQDFSGIYFSYVGIANHEFDAYAFFREFQDSSFTADGGGLGDLEDRTLGARIKGKDFGFDYTLEAMAQGGHFSTDRIAAYAYAATLGYTFDCGWKPRIMIEYAYASGDRNVADGKRNTFDPLFPFFHYYQGYADVFGFKNSQSLAAYLKVSPSESVSLHADLFAFRLARTGDAWYNDPGLVLRPRAPGTGSSRKIGSEIDLHAKVNIGKHVKIWGGWSHFFAGEFVRKTATTGPKQDMNWFFLQMTVDF